MTKWKMRKLNTLTLIFIVGIIFSFAFISFAEASIVYDIDFGTYAPNQTVLFDNFSRSDSGTIGNAFIPNTNWVEYEDATGVCGIKNFAANCTLSTADNNLGRIEHNWSSINLTKNDLLVFQMNISLQSTDDTWIFQLWELNRSIARGIFLPNGTFEYSNGSTPSFISVGSVFSVNTWNIFRAEFNRTTNKTSYFINGVPLAIKTDTSAYTLASKETTLSLGGWIGSSGTKDITLWDYVFLGSITQALINSNEYNETIIETEKASFITNVSIGNSLLSSVNLVRDGTAYAGTITNLGNNNSLLSKTIDVPEGVGLKSWYWNIIYTNGSILNTSSFVQSVQLLNFSICGASPQNTPFINFTFKDEGNLSRIRSSIASSSFSYYVGSGTVNKTLSFQDTTARDSFAFCGSPSTKTIYVSANMPYYATGYPQRTYHPSSPLTLTNTVTNNVLYLLATADGIYSSFQTIEASGVTITGVSVTAERLIESSYVTLEEGTTDSSGLVTFWLNPNYEHRVTATKTGYLTSQVNVRPSQSIYSIIMSRSTGDATFNGSLKGLKWSILPEMGIIASGSHTFYFNLTSSINNIDSCKMELVYKNETLLSSGTGGSSGGCNLSLSATLSDNELIYGRYYVDTTDSDGYFLIDRDARWEILTTNEKPWLNFKGFISDLRDAPEFGTGIRGEYSRILLFFFFLTLFTGLFAYFTGYDSVYPGALVFLILIAVFFFSTVGWFTLDFGENTPLFIEKYYVFIISFLISGGWIANYYSRQ